MDSSSIEVPTLHVELSSTMFHEYAIQYLNCCQSFTPSTPCSPVPFFLICRSIEMELKAKHLTAISRDKVKTLYWHKLKKSYDDLPTAEKVLSSPEYRELVKACGFYAKKDFEYVPVFDAVTNLKNFPNLEVLKNIATKLIGE